MKRKDTFGLGTGTISIIMIFVILCLTVIAILSYVLCNKDNNMSNKKASYVEQYYLADGKAIDILARIDNELYNMCEKKISFSRGAYEKKVHFPEGLFINYDKKEIRYRVSITGKSYLDVVLKVNLDGKYIDEKERYNIKKWMVVCKEEKVGKANLNVFK